MAQSDEAIGTTIQEFFALASKFCLSACQDRRAFPNNNCGQSQEIIWGLQSLSLCFPQPLVLQSRVISTFVLSPTMP